MPKRMPPCATAYPSPDPSPARSALCLAAAAHGGLCIFHLGSAKRVATVAAHAKNLRALAYDGTNNLLLTCSFDRTVKVWEAAGAGGRAAECRGTLSSQTGGGGLDP